MLDLFFIFLSQRLIPPSETEPLPAIALEDVVQHFLNTSTEGSDIRKAEIKSKSADVVFDDDGPVATEEMEKATLVASYLQKVSPGIAREFQV